MRTLVRECGQSEFEKKGTRAVPRYFEGTGEAFEKASRIPNETAAGFYLGLANTGVPVAGQINYIRREPY